MDEPETARPGVAQAARRPTVLVVDDDPVFRAVMDAVLRQRGAGDIVEAADGDQAHRILREGIGRIDVITLDLSMPNLDGVRFLRLASELGFSGRLVLISGEHQSVVASAGKLAGMLRLDCRATFAKPVDFHAVAEVALSTAAAGERADAATIDVDEINAGLRNSRLMAYYQPRVDLLSGRVLGAEALARMRGRDGGLLDAARMIDLAEQNGRITDITWRMIEIITADARELGRRVPGPPKLSFNISSSILADIHFPRRLADTFRQAGLRPQGFILELTESRIPADASRALETLTLLRMQGFELAIDDFGTGYSNIEQLRMFPFTELKVDKQFMTAARFDGFARACVEASVALARELNLRVVAEGIEGEAELELARAHSMAEAQGYLFSRPLPFAEFVDFANANRDGQGHTAGQATA
ncbi:MAG: transcriptional regulator [Alphaproteobacteria bacterium]|nr:MAG: transcriptional regulator [Alphaproteobacteria bacterium]